MTHEVILVNFYKIFINQRNKQLWADSRAALDKNGGTELATKKRVASFYLPD